MNHKYLIFGGPTQEQKDLRVEGERTAIGVSQQQAETAKKQQALSEKLFKQFGEFSRPIADFAFALLGGDREAIGRQFGTQLEDISTQTATAQDLIRKRAPRGGEQSLALAQTEIAKTGQRANILGQAPDKALGMLGNLASLVLGQAPAFAQVGVGAVGVGARAGLGVAGAVTQQQAVSNQLLQSVLGAGGDIGGFFGGGLANIKGGRSFLGGTKA